MAYELYLRHYDRDGSVKNAVVNPLWARFTDAVNEDAPLVFALNEESEEADAAEEFDLFEVMVRNRALGLTDFERAFVGVLRHWELETDEDGLTYWRFEAPHQRHILGWRSVLWPAGTNRRSDFRNVAFETLAKELVQYNFTSDAAHDANDPNSRWRDGDLAPGMGVTIDIATDQGRGNNVTKAFAGGNVLGILQRLAPEGGGDFDLRWQGGAIGGAADTWQFEFYPGQLGEDKSSGADRVLFSRANSTLLRPRLRRRGATATVAIAAGQGPGAARETSTVQGDDYAADYDIEMFVDARNEATAGGRQEQGAEKLEGAQVVEELTFNVLQTADVFYSPVAVTGRKTYRAGDLVLASYGGEHVRKIRRLKVDWQVPDRGAAFAVDVTTEAVTGA